MPSYARSRDVVVAAPPELRFDVMTDHARMPEWQRSVKRAAVLSGSPAEGEAVVEYELDVRLRSVVYRLRELYERPHRVGSEYAGGDMRDMGGEWTFAPERAGATLVTF